MNVDWRSILKWLPILSALDKKDANYLIEASDEIER
jgi:hypothetical protein